jgi:hypothetical protein
MAARHGATCKLYATDLTLCSNWKQQNSYPLPTNLLAQDVEARVQGRVRNLAPEPGS